jgi:hypothetical protein
MKVRWASPVCSAWAWSVTWSAETPPASAGVHTPNDGGSRPPGLSGGRPPGAGVRPSTPPVGHVLEVGSPKRAGAPPKAEPLAPAAIRARENDGASRRLEAAAVANPDEGAAGVQGDTPPAPGGWPIAPRESPAPLTTLSPFTPGGPKPRRRKAHLHPAATFIFAGPDRLTHAPPDRT